MEFILNYKCNKDTDDEDDSDDMSSVSLELLTRQVTPQKDATHPIPNFITTPSSSTSSICDSPHNESHADAIPSLFRLMQISQLTRIQKKADKYDRLIQTLSRSHYAGTSKSDTVLGFAASLLPQCGYSGIATIIPFITSVLLLNAGISVPPDNLISSLPSPQYIQNTVTNYAVDTSLLVRDSNFQQSECVSVL